MLKFLFSHLGHDPPESYSGVPWGWFCFYSRWNQGSDWWTDSLSCKRQNQTQICLVQTTWSFSCILLHPSRSRQSEQSWAPGPVAGAGATDINWTQACRGGAQSDGPRFALWQGMPGSCVFLMGKDCGSKHRANLRRRGEAGEVLSQEIKTAQRKGFFPSYKAAKQRSKVQTTGPKLYLKESSRSEIGSQTCGTEVQSLLLFGHCYAERKKKVAGGPGSSCERPTHPSCLTLTPRWGLWGRTSWFHGTLKPCGGLQFPSDAPPRQLQPGVSSNPPATHAHTHTLTCMGTHSYTHTLPWYCVLEPRPRPQQDLSPGNPAPILPSSPISSPSVQLCKLLCGRCWVTPGIDQAEA